MVTRDVVLIAIVVAVVIGLLGFAIGWLSGFDARNRISAEIDEAERLKTIARRHEQRA